MEISRMTIHADCLAGNWRVTRIPAAPDSMARVSVIPVKRNVAAALKARLGVPPGRRSVFERIAVRATMTRTWFLSSLLGFAPGGMVFARREQAGNCLAANVAVHFKQRQVLGTYVVASHHANATEHAFGIRNHLEP